MYTNRSGLCSNKPLFTKTRWRQAWAQGLKFANLWPKSSAIMAGTEVCWFSSLLWVYRCRWNVRTWLKNNLLIHSFIAFKASVLSISSFGSFWTLQVRWKEFRTSRAPVMWVGEGGALQRAPSSCVQNRGLCAMQGSAVLSKTGMFGKRGPLCLSPQGTRHRLSPGEWNILDLSRSCCAVPAYRRPNWVHLQVLWILFPLPAPQKIAGNREASQR